MIIKKLVSFFKNEIVLCLATTAAIVSCFFVTPDLAYFSYIDWDTMLLLFSLMTVMKGFQKAGFFVFLSGKLLKKTNTSRKLMFVLIFLPFTLSMLITNDVALITFVPFGMTVLEITNRKNLIIPLVVLQTIAANMGSALTPMGNPQNLYLYSASGLSFGQFCLLMMPYTLISGIFIFLPVIFIKPDKIVLPNTEYDFSSKKYIIFGVFGFLLCISGIFDIISPIPIAAIILVFLIFADRKLQAEIDYPLLATFFVFFIFTGNISRMELFKTLIGSIISNQVITVSVLTSQIISNVPAALLLSGFTDNWEALITGCNIGWLGTLIASMASLISYKMITKEYPGYRKKYFAAFTIYNIILLLILMAASLIL